MTNSHRRWTVADRQRFIEVLTETGNPATAALSIGQPLAAAYRMRETCPQFGDDWQRALSNAWEQVEMRMLSTLLVGAAADIDPKVALEMLKRRGASPPPQRSMITIDAAKLARVRAEIRALEAPKQ
jgi:hypothetical protein